MEGVEMRDFEGVNEELEAENETLEPEGELETP